MALPRTILLVSAAGLLSGCVSLSRSEAVTPLSPEAARDARVTEIVLTRGELAVSPEFDDLFRKRVQTKLDGCAAGTRPLRLEARIDRLDKANPVVTAVVAGANVLRGAARLVDPATGQAVGEYQIGSTVVGGRLAVIRMAEAEEQMSDAFGQELCEQAFGAKAEPAPSAQP